MVEPQPLSAEQVEQMQQEAARERAAGTSIGLLQGFTVEQLEEVLDDLFDGRGEQFVKQVLEETLEYLSVPADKPAGRWTQPGGYAARTDATEN